MAAAAAALPSEEDSGLHFAVPEGTVSITGGWGDPKGGSWAGWEVDKTKVTSVTIPSSVTSIGKEAFEGCTSLASVDIPISNVLDQHRPQCFQWMQLLGK